MGCEHEPPTLVCFAVKEEAAAFKQFARGWPAVELLLTGMGEKNAERAIRSRLSQGKPKLVLSCGFAGGLAPQLAGGTLVFDAEDQPALRTLWLKAGAQPARFYCAHRVAITTEEKQALRES